MPADRRGGPGEPEHHVAAAARGLRGRQIALQQERLQPRHPAKGQAIARKESTRGGIPPGRMLRRHAATIARTRPDPGRSCRSAGNSGPPASPARRGRAGRSGSRSCRSRLTYAWTSSTALRGGRSPHSTSTITSLGTPVVQCSASSPSTARCRGDPSPTAAPARIAVSGPSTPIRTSGPHVQSPPPSRRTPRPCPVACRTTRSPVPPARAGPCPEQPPSRSAPPTEGTASCPAPDPLCADAHPGRDGQFLLSQPDTHAALPHQLAEGAPVTTDAARGDGSPGGTAGAPPQFSPLPVGMMKLRSQESAAAVSSQTFPAGRPSP